MLLPRYSKIPLYCQNPTWQATANLISDNAEAGSLGQIMFRQWLLSDSLTVTMKVNGLPPGKHGIHIHAFGDTKEGCKSTGPHLSNILVNILIIY